jgi:arylformamidase
MLNRISYTITSQSPLYPGTPPVSCQEIKSIQKGDSANTSLLSMSTHTGTHIDVPRHFCPEGKSVRDLVGEMLDLAPVYCIDVEVRPNDHVGVPDIRPFIGQLRGAAGLLIRTGMYRVRASDPAMYCTSHPWIHPDVPRFLREECPDLRLFGTDTISVSSPSHRTEGRECHRAFLCNENPILLLEDLDLSDPSLTSGPMNVTMYPWISDVPDGVPVQVFVEFLSQTIKNAGDSNP